MFKILLGSGIVYIWRYLQQWAQHFHYCVRFKSSSSSILVYFARNLVVFSASFRIPPKSKRSTKAINVINYQHRKRHITSLFICRFNSHCLDTITDANRSKRESEWTETRLNEWKHIFFCFTNTYTSNFPCGAKSGYCFTKCRAKYRQYTNIWMDWY